MVSLLCVLWCWMYFCVDFMFDIPWGTKICTLESVSEFFKPSPSCALHRSDCHSSQGSPVFRTTYRNTEQIKDRNNKLLFKMEISMNLNDAQDGRGLYKNSQHP